MPGRKQVKRKKGKPSGQRGGMTLRTAVYRPTFSTQYGNGFFGSVWNGIKKAGNFVGANKLISTGLDVAGMVGVPGASMAGKVAKQVGLGNKKRKRRVRKH